MLPYREIWAVDFEFISESGERPKPVCMVARELRSGRLLRLWRDNLMELRRPPFDISADVLFIAHYSSAEFNCFLALNWPMPARILDLFVEFRATTNGLPTPCGRGLLGALQWHGLDAMAADEKTAMRALILRGGPWSADERRAILDYCQADVDALAELFPRMLPAILGRQRLERPEPQGGGGSPANSTPTSIIPSVKYRSPSALRPSCVGPTPGSWNWPVSIPAAARPAISWSRCASTSASIWWVIWPVRWLTPLSRSKLAEPSQNGRPSSVRSVRHQRT